MGSATKPAEPKAKPAPKLSFADEDEEQQEDEPRMS